MKKKYVLFHNNDAQLFSNQKPKKLGKADIILENPDLSRVVGVSPHYWKLVEGNIIFPMNAAERAWKDRMHPKHYKKFKGYNYKKIIGHFLFVSMCLLFGMAICYVLIKQGRLK